MDKKNLNNKTILITGGTGSFGKTMIDHLGDSDVSEIRVFSRDELKQELMRKELQDDRIRYYLGDIRDASSIRNAMKGVDLVFHAAALKQVPSCEFFPSQAVMTNVTGSVNVMEAAIHEGVEHLVCLSTDKAVYPINAMGMTKALMEKSAQALARNLGASETKISSVRYGNVMYSRGSVIPLFINQMKAGEDLTITEPSMTRFMLPLQQAIDLVIYAFEHAAQGDIFIRKAPACTVQQLADALKDIFQSGVGIKHIGMRHGEKIYETLATREELSRSEDMGNYYRISMDSRDLDYSKYFTEGDVGEVLLEDYTSHNTQQLDHEELKLLLLSLPEVKSELRGHKHI